MTWRFNAHCSLWKKYLWTKNASGRVVSKEKWIEWWKKCSFKVHTRKGFFLHLMLCLWNLLDIWNHVFLNRMHHLFQRLSSAVQTKTQCPLLRLLPLIISMSVLQLLFLRRNHGGSKLSPWLMTSCWSWALMILPQAYHEWTGLFLCAARRPTNHHQNSNGPRFWSLVSMLLGHFSMQPTSCQNKPYYCPMSFV